MKDHSEQRMPVPNGSPSIQSLVRDDLVQREAVGVSRYGTALQPHNGRDALRDAYEEVLDLACYVRQEMTERETPPRPWFSLLLAERARQVRQGATPQHDDHHHVGQLAQAAACYALPHWMRDGHVVPVLWPWEPSSWQPSVTGAWSGIEDRRRELVKAGALLLAEWERLDRLETLEQDAQYREDAEEMAAADEAPDEP